MSDFAIILAILAFCAVDATLGLETPKLLVPSELKVLMGCFCGQWVCAPHSSHPAMLLLFTGPAL